MATLSESIDSKTELIGYMIDNNGKRIKVKVEVDKKGFIKFIQVE